MFKFYSFCSYKFWWCFFIFELYDQIFCLFSSNCISQGLAIYYLDFSQVIITWVQDQSAFQSCYVTLFLFIHEQQCHFFLHRQKITTRHPVIEFFGMDNRNTNRISLIPFFFEEFTIAIAIVDYQFRGDECQFDKMVICVVLIWYR